ncbi:hypothetical protein SPBR_01111 [Sporothrix brasiliensis 5110]|uniref:Uncharacterized protein n=1 Tax=Sporothrix brasiliensis 5110 TaxID=1398154 RepID=A0A0C2FIC4_9PEZI|nr:uncharacterized protein SPBR_01111 [Sporothrix brasiliensis 5110]KIH90803.1 hypothetical protein SPBR_01111 [Sporothrix brasiliensis 5110]
MALALNWPDLVAATLLPQVIVDAKSATDGTTFMTVQKQKDGQITFLVTLPLVKGQASRHGQPPRGQSHTTKGVVPRREVAVMCWE